MRFRQKIRDRIRSTSLAARLLAGRRFYLVPPVPLLWSAFLALMVVTGGVDEAPGRASAQGTLIGMPLSVLAVFLGVRVIAGEIDSRRMEIAYTVPGGAHRLWMTKLLAALGILLVSEVLLAIVAFVFFTKYPPMALYGALQAATFYLVLAMWLSTLLRSEVTGALLGVAALVVSSLFLSGTRFSPFWNPLSFDDVEPNVLLGWAVQNRIGFLLAIAAVTALAFGRAERREKMLGA